jgi:hypothetical protein
MNETKSVTITFQDEGPKTFSYEVDRRDNPRLTCPTSDDEVTLYLNSAGCVELAEFLLKLGHSSYDPGYHVHIGKDFDPDQSDVLCLTLSEK